MHNTTICKVICNTETQYIVVLCKKEKEIVSKKIVESQSFAFWNEVCKDLLFSRETCFEMSDFCDIIDVMKIEIVKMRRKTICLKILDSEHAILKVPKSISQKKIDEFLQSKRDWLAKSAKKLREREHFGETFDFMKYIYFDGKPFVETGELSMDFELLSDVKKKSTIKKFYLSHFSDLEEFAKQISMKTGLKYKEIRPTSSVRVWGSFSAQKVMKLNWKLLILPRSLIEYVICHELCHGLHMNHQPKFWKAVEKICPDFKERKKELSNFSFVLKNGL